MYKIIIFDIGGTLLDKKTSDKINEKTSEDINELRNKGIKVGVCSMRTYNQCKKVIPIELDFYICLNGSYIICNDRVIHNNPIIDDVSVLDTLTYSEEKAYFSSQKSYNLAMENGFVVDEKGVASKIYNLVKFNVKSKELSQYEKFHFEYWTQAQSLMLQNVNSSKSSAIKRVLKHYSFNNKILYFGDGPNDLEIFKKYNDCICMGSCYAELEKHALFKTGTVAENGVSTALKKLNLL